MSDDVDLFQWVRCHSALAEWCRDVLELQRPRSMDRTPAIYETGVYIAYAAPLWIRSVDMATDLMHNTEYEDKAALVWAHTRRRVELVQVFLAGVSLGGHEALEPMLALLVDAHATTQLAWWWSVPRRR